jgi:hypothetical protein
VFGIRRRLFGVNFFSLNLAKKENIFCNKKNILAQKEIFWWEKKWEWRVNRGSQNLKESLPNSYGKPNGIFAGCAELSSSYYNLLTSKTDG